MSHFFGLSLTSLGFLSIIFGIIYFVRPSIIICIYQKFVILYCGLTVKDVKGKGITFHYGEKNKRIPGKTSIVLLHGFSSSMEMWTPFLKLLPKDIHCVILDLPGHGKTIISKEEDISFFGQVKRIHEFVKLVGLDEAPFHLVGASMGGTLAGLYTVEYPQFVDRLTLISPAMKTLVENGFSKQVEEIMHMDNHKTFRCLLIPETPEEVQHMLDLMTYHKFKLPTQILKGIADIRCPKKDFYLKLFKTLVTKENLTLLQENMDKITAPTQLVWGKQDAIIDISGLDILKKVLPNCQQVNVITECAHIMLFDTPGKTTKAILSFHDKIL